MRQEKRLYRLSVIQAGMDFMRKRGITFRVKKTVAFILAIFYLSFSIGATLNQHYCMGELTCTSLFDLQDDDCGKCGMKKHTEASKGCCKDISIMIKSGDSHTFSQTVYNFHPPIFTLPVIYVISARFNISKAPTENLYRAHSPPLLKNLLFLQFGTLRI